MLTIRGVLSTLWLIAAGWLSPSQAATPASAAATLKPGTIVINPQFDSVGSFSDGLAAVRSGDARTGKWGFIDKTGRIVINPQFDSAEPFSDGLAMVRIGDFTTGKVGFIDKTGHYVINPQFGLAHSFGDGLAAVRIGSKWGFIAR